MAFIIILLTFSGLASGSFINALVWRLHQQRSSKSNKYSILHGRSMCVHCKHTLAWYDLFPVLSWLWLRGKCRYCKQPISFQYPAVELVTALIFVSSYLFWPDTVHLNGQWLLLSTWLVSVVGLIALAVYDLRWMLLPNRIIYPTLAVTTTGRGGYIILFSPKPWHDILLWIGSVAVASGVFFVLFMISKGKWIGYGDVRLGLVTGTLITDPQKSLAMLFLASLIGTLVILPALSQGNKKLTSKLPYGPFLILATAIVVLFGDSLLNWYKGLII